MSKGFEWFDEAIKVDSFAVSRCTTKECRCQLSNSETAQQLIKEHVPMTTHVHQKKSPPSFWASIDKSQQNLSKQLLIELSRLNESLERLMRGKKCKAKGAHVTQIDFCKDFEGFFYIDTEFMERTPL